MVYFVGLFTIVMTNEGLLPQNKQLTIIPSGIKRHQHDINCKDDGCEEVINMRYKNGTWKTVGGKVPLWEYNHQCNTLYYHAEINTADTALYIGYRIADHKIYLVDADGESKTEIKQLSISPFETLQHFTSLNKILVVTTSLNVYYFRWDDDTDAYVELPKEIAVDISFQYEAADDGEIVIQGGEGGHATQKELFDDILIQKYKMRQRGYFCRAWVVMQYAYRLWDGSYIMHSNPVLVKLGGTEAYFYKRNNLDDPEDNTYGTALDCGYPIFYINAASGVLTNLDKYKGLLTDLCIFMSQDVSQYLYQYVETPYGKDSIADYYQFVDNAESLAQLMNMAPYYLAKEIPIKEVIDSVNTDKFIISLNEATNKVNYDGNGGSSVDTVEKIPVRHNTCSRRRVGNRSKRVKGGDATPNVLYTMEDTEQTTETTDEAGSFILQAQQELPVDDFSHHSIIGLSNPYVFNAKLHIGNIKVKFGKGHQASEWYEFSGDYELAPIPSGWTFYREITIKTDMGTRYILESFTPYLFTYVGSIPESSGTYILRVPNVISYPDVRATRIRIIGKNSTDSDYCQLADYELKSHKIYNFAYAITNQTVTGSDPGYILYDGDNISMQSLLSENWLTPGDTADALATENRYYEDTNRVQVSAVNNPIYFPSILSYQIGNSAVEILCFGSQSAPVSAGQFGQLPMAVFTSQGMFLMQQGGGEVIYSSVVPLNNEVAYKNSVCELGGALVYASSDGIKLLSGNKTSHLSREVEGDPSDKLTADAYYINFITDPNGHLVFLYPYLSAENFLDYLDDNVRVCYDKINKELIVTNRDMFTDDGRAYQTPYSYVYNLQSRTWHKITDSWHQFMMINSVWYGARNYRTGYPTGQGLHNMNSEREVLMDCMIQSRPQKWGSFELKKMKTIVQRSLCHVGDPIDSSQDADDKFGLYMFAAMENNLYEFCKGIKVSQPYGMIQNPALPGVHQSVRNVVLLTAVRSKNFVFSHWEIMSEITLPGKLGVESRKNTEVLQGDYNPEDYGESYNTEYIETL